MRTAVAVLGFLAFGCASTARAPETPAEHAAPAESAPEPVAVTVAQAPAPIPTAAAPGEGFVAPTVEVVRITTTTEVAVKLVRADDIAPWSGPVRYTAEPFTVTGPPIKGFVRERNVLGSRRAFDLNGDGDTKDRFRAGCDGEAFTLGPSARLDPVMAGTSALRRYAYDQRIASVAEGGAAAMLYLACGAQGVSVGLAPESMEVREIPGPALMVLSFGNPKLPPTIPADGVSRTPEADGLADQRFDVEVYEPVTEGPLWYAVAGAMVQLDAQASEQEIRVFIEGDVEAVQISINEGGQGVDRARSFVSTQAVGSR